MEKENNETALVDEPSIDSRFGFEAKGHALSGTAIKLCAISTVVCLVTVLWIKSPDKTEAPDSSSGVKTPEISEVGMTQSQLSVDNYSAESERNQINIKNKQKSGRNIVRLPGLQKIDRAHAGQIPPGSEVKAKLLTGASNGLVRAEVLESLKIRGETFMSRGDTLMGQGQSTEERLFIRFTQVIHHDGSVEPIQGQAADVEDKMAGLKGAEFKRYALKYGAAVGLNFVGGMTVGLQDRTIVGQQVVTTPDAKNALLNGASRAAIEMANDQMADIRNQPPPITIDAGQEIVVIFESAQ